MRTWRMQDAGSRFEDLFDAALNEGPQRIARRGRAAVVMVPEKEWGRLAEHLPSFGQLLASRPLGGAELPGRRAARALKSLRRPAGRSRRDVAPELALA